jgi:hypothetical protein
MVGLSEVVGQLTQLVAAVTASGGNLNTLITSFQQHLLNPISHDKSQVGLSLVPNFPKATPDDVAALSDTAVMTPRKTINMLKDYSELLSDDTKVTKDVSVTGGGLATGGGTLSTDQIIRVNVASAADVRTGTSDSVAMTPKTGALLVEMWKEKINPPLDNNSVEILNIDNIGYPGVYRLSTNQIFGNGNFYRLPKQLFDGEMYSHRHNGVIDPTTWERYSYKLTVREVDGLTPQHTWVEQLLSRNTNAAGYDNWNHDVVYRRVGNAVGDGTWDQWHQISGFTNILASYYSNNYFNNSGDTTYGKNCTLVPAQIGLDRLETADGYSSTAGNYTAEQLLAIQTIMFIDRPPVDEYSVNISCLPRLDGGIVYSGIGGAGNTNSWDPGGVGQFITLHIKMLHQSHSGFSFMVEDVRLGNDGIIRRNPASFGDFSISVIVLGVNTRATLTPPPP